MEDRAKDWWDAVERRYPDGISWDQIQQEFTDRFFPQSHKDSKIEEFFKLEQKNMSDRPPFLVTGICRQLHSNLPAKLARLISCHEAKPLKLLKLPLKNVGYKKNFTFLLKSPL